MNKFNLACTEYMEDCNFEHTRYLLWFPTPKKKIDIVPYMHFCVSSKRGKFIWDCTACFTRCDNGTGNMLVIEGYIFFYYVNLLPQVFFRNQCNNEPQISINVLFYLNTSLQMHLSVFRRLVTGM